MWVGGNDSDALDWSGSESTINGSVQSNGGIKIGGSDNRFNGGTTWVKQFDNGGSNNRFNPTATQGSVASWPLDHYTLADFKPGGKTALAAGDQYHNLSRLCRREDKWDKCGT